MITRGIAAFFGAFALLNLLGGWLAPGFDANIWWIDFSPLPQAVVTVMLALGGFALLVYAIRPVRDTWPPMFVAMPIVLLAATALADVVRFYRLLHRHAIATSVPVPFSALVCAALGLIAWRAVRPNARAESRRGFVRGAIAFVGCVAAFPLAQIYFFGHSDYRRQADAIVVFGARAYADGSPSGVLADRVLTACQLYQQGRAGLLIFSGGPGDGAIDEPEAMRRLARKSGVPDSAIQLDHEGVNTEATVHNTMALFGPAQIRRVLAVSHSYHLPRIKMCYRQAGWEVYTVPATEHFRLPGAGRFLIVREVAAIWAYYLHPLE